MINGIIPRLKLIMINCSKVIFTWKFFIFFKYEIFENRKQ